MITIISPTPNLLKAESNAKNVERSLLRYPKNVIMEYMKKKKVSKKGMHMMPGGMMMSDKEMKKIQKKMMVEEYHATRGKKK